MTAGGFDLNRFRLGQCSCAPRAAGFLSPRLEIPAWACRNTEGPTNWQTCPCTCHHREPDGPLLLLGAAYQAREAAELRRIEKHARQDAIALRLAAFGLLLLLVAVAAVVVCS